MEDSARFVSLKWVVSDTYYHSTSEPPKNALKNRKTKQYIRSDDGSYLTREPNKLILTVQTEDGRKYSEDIMGSVKYVCGRISVTKTVRKKLENTFSTWPFRVYTRSDGSKPAIYGTYDAIRSALK